MRITRPSVTAAAIAATAASLLTAAAAHAVTAAVPTPGNLLIYRSGDGTAVQASDATSVWIDEYTPAGQFVNTWGMPQVTNEANNVFALTTGATTTTEGGLSISLDGQWAVFTGYRADVGTTGLTTSPVPRVIGRLNLATGATDTDTSLGLSYTNPDGAAGAQGSSIRGIAATDGTHFWTAGTSKNSNENGGTVYTVGNGPTAVSTVVRNLNQRGIGIFGGELYVNNSGTTFRKQTSAIGDPGVPGYPLLPTMSGVTDTTILGGQTNVEDFLMYDLSETVPGIDTLYFPTSTGGTANLLKFTSDGTNWNAAGSADFPSFPAANSSLFHIAGKQNTDGSITFFLTNTGTTGGTPNGAAVSNLYTITDSSGFASSLSGTATLLTTSADNTTFRGLGIVPGAVVPPHITGDTNNDGVVDLADLNNVLNNFGSNTPGNPGDDNHDNVVDLQDLNNVLNNFGSHAAAAALAVPEPATLSLAALAGTTLLARRRRA